MAKVLVTGVNGFVGGHLATELASKGHEVVGVGREQNYKHKDGGILKDYLGCDLADPTEVAKLPLETIDAVISLAGLTNVRESFDKADTYKKINVAVLSVLGQELIKRKLRPRVIAV